MKALDGIAEVGECPFWYDGRWLWVDNFCGTVFSSDGETTTERAADAVCALPRQSGDPLIITATAIGTHRAPAGTRFNDGKCDALGRLWIGSMSLTGQPGQGALFRYDGNDLMLIAGNFDVSNGLGWSPDYRIMYFTDTGKRVIYRYEFDLATGTLGERSIFHQFGDGGKPDGLAVDAEGGVWVALWDGGCVIRLSSSGVVIDRIVMPVPRPTSLAFGDGQMLVTSARRGLTETQLAGAPQSGRSFLMQAPVAGMPVQSFKG